MGWSRYFRRRQWDEERAREVAAHLEIETGENIARGMEPGEARDRARRKLGNATQIREEIYRMNTIGFIETLWQDLRYGARLLRLNPGFTAVAILSLALGIGANTAIFQLLDAVRLRTLPVKNPQELAVIKMANMQWNCCHFSGRYSEMTNALWEQVRDHQQAFSGALAWGTKTLNLGLGGEARVTENGIWVSGDFFNVLGVPPILGRVFTAADDRRSCGSPGVVISYSFWQREFGGAASAIGKKLTLDGHPFEVIGVTPAGFFGVEVGRTFDVAVPLCAEPVILGETSNLDRRDGWWLSVMGRLKPGWTLQKASAHLRSLSPGFLEATLPALDPDGIKHYLEYKLEAFPAGTGISALRETYDRPLWLLLSIAGLVLLIACANLANLMLARASAREREIAVRLALGAARGRLVRQLLAESLLLASAGAFAGAWLAHFLSGILVSFLSTAVNPVFVDLATDWRVLAFTAGLAVLTSVLFGLTPALRATRTAPGAVLKTSGRGMTARRERFGLRRVLVVSQVALSLVLLVGALLFVRSLRNLLVLDAGFAQNGILVADVDLRRTNIPPERRRTFKRELLDRFRAIPGVDSAAQAQIIPISDDGWNQTVMVDGAREPLVGISFFNRITPEYFRTMQTPLLAGRDFDARDTLNSPKIAIVNEAFAKRFFQGANPVGKTFRLKDEQGTLIEIAGLVKNTKYWDLREAFRPIGYFAASQEQRPGESSLIVMRSNAPVGALMASVKRTMTGIDPGIGYRFHVLKNEIRDSLARESLIATLSGFFGFLAVTLATIGLYGVMSYMAARRRSEIGIRMALGASRGDVVSLILREAGVLLGVGLAAGTVLSLAVARMASSMLFGLEPYDPATIGIAVVGLAGVALAASYLPARRAARVDPMVALREE